MTSSTRLLRATGIGALSLCLVAVGLGTTTSGAAVADEAPRAAVGDADQVLIESAHALGKTAVIGEGEWALSSRSIASEPADVLRQAVSMYPVVGTEDTFVLTNGDGDVLARTEGERSLELLEVTPDEAAEIALATWVVEHREDRAMILNGAPLNGLDAALNLYGWSTAHGAQIATWDRGDYGANESWRIHQLHGVADAIGAVVAPGAAPTLPGTVTARYSWGPTTELTDIVWELPSDDVWNVDGVVPFVGYAEGLFDESVRVDATYTVGALGDALDSELTSYAGVMLDTLKRQAPRTVERRVSGSDVTVTEDVTWDWNAIDPGALTRVGELTVPAAAGTGFGATLRITLTEATAVNQLRTDGVRSWRLEGSEDLSGLTNGNREAEAFGDWRAGGAPNRVNPNWVAFYFDRPRQLTGAAIYEPAGADNIGAVSFQFRNMRGGWEDVSVGKLPNDGGRLAMETDFDAVMATGFRAVIEHKSDDMWMQLSEIEAWGPGL